MKHFDVNLSDIIIYLYKIQGFEHKDLFYKFLFFCILTFITFYI